MVCRLTGAQIYLLSFYQSVNHHITPQALPHRPNHRMQLPKSPLPAKNNRERERERKRQSPSLTVAKICLNVWATREKGSKPERKISSSRKAALKKWLAPILCPFNGREILQKWKDPWNYEAICRFASSRSF